MIGLETDLERRAASEESYVRILAFVAALLALLPTLLNWAFAPPGHRYLGIQTNLDDHMVYAAWMRQAMDGHLLFDNRFAVDAQPGLTIHLFFLALGWIAKLTGIPLAMAASRVVFTFAFVHLLYRLVRKVCPDIYTTKLAMALSVFGGGIGFAVWHTFGRELVRPMPEIARNVMLGRLPTDVWQPEGFVFPSMLTSGLFMASLCLIVTVFLAFLSARDSWQRVPIGVAAMFLLMNIHSYDVLLVAFTMTGFLVMSAVAGQTSGAWIARSLVMAAGAIPPALWFLHVLQNDPVFQARAATPTYSPNFRQVVFGYLGLMLLGLVAFALGSRGVASRSKNLIAALVLAGMLLAGFVAAGGHLADGYFLSLTTWLVVAAIGLVALAFIAEHNSAWNLVGSWAVMGTVAIYFPALYQRKLTMGLAIPWALLAAIAVGMVTRKLDRPARNLSLVLAIVLLSATSLRWFAREVELGKLNVSNTTVHNLYLSPDVNRIVEHLSRASSKRVVVIAMPGIRNQRIEAKGNPVPDTFDSPYIPDLNPVLSGLAAVYSYAGHWSETPDYERRRAESTRFFLPDMSDADRRVLLTRIGARFVVAPVPESFPFIGLADVRSLGSVVYEGPQFRLIEVR